MLCYILFYVWYSIPSANILYIFCSSSCIGSTFITPRKKGLHLPLSPVTHPPEFGNADRQRLIDEVWIVMSLYTLIEQQVHIWNHVYRWISNLNDFIVNWHWRHFRYDLTQTETHNCGIYMLLKNHRMVITIYSLDPRYWCSKKKKTMI